MAMVGAFGLVLPTGAGSDARISANFGYRFVSSAGAQISFNVDNAPSATTEVDIDLSGVAAAVELVSWDPAGLCAPQAGQRLRCHITTGADSDSFRLQLKAKPGAPLGPAGSVVATVSHEQDPNPGNNVARTKLDVFDQAQGARVELNAPGTLSGSIGQTITLNVTARNHGPNTIGKVWIGNVEAQSGVRFAGYTGCAHTTSITCATPIIAKGAGHTVGLRLKIEGCVGGGGPQGTFPWSYVPGEGHEVAVKPPYSPRRFVVAVAGCQPPPPPPGQGSGGQGEGTSEIDTGSSATPQATTSIAISAMPSLTAGSAEAPIARTAEQEQAQRSTWIVIAVITVALAGLAAALGIRHRRRRGTEDS